MLDCITAHLVNLRVTQSRAGANDATEVATDLLGIVPVVAVRLNQAYRRPVSADRTGICM